MSNKTAEEVLKVEAIKYFNEMCLPEKWGEDRATLMLQDPVYGFVLTAMQAYAQQEVERVLDTIQQEWGNGNTPIHSAMTQYLQSLSKPQKPDEEYIDSETEWHIYDKLTSVGAKTRCPECDEYYPIHTHDCSRFPLPRASSE